MGGGERVELNYCDLNFFVFWVAANLVAANLTYFLLPCQSTSSILRTCGMVAPVVNRCIFSKPSQNSVLSSGERYPKPSLYWTHFWLKDSTPFLL